ncbi:hypothetical protein [Geomicrobium sp. JCM 19039]|uniref:hypothetical protein n=1 Tax=Geomicrobium sp. JCM 19039 TaxID=1460636 RepID=UPI00045F2BAC|nr:hypothetical protein [Geomicrobium sp. JCM 19039]GAK12213.1 hypothetical protein JCM19039_1962 [Geomicrobium sp. JCM 19039]
MTVRELIEELIKHDMDAEVRVCVNKEQVYEITSEIAFYKKYWYGNELSLEVNLEDHLLIKKDDYEELLQIKEDPTA